MSYTCTHNVLLKYITSSYVRYRSLLNYKTHVLVWEDHVLPKLTFYLHDHSIVLIDSVSHLLKQNDQCSDSLEKEKTNSFWFWL